MKSNLCLLAFVFMCAGLTLGQQNPSGTYVPKASAKTLVVEDQPKSPSEVAIPPSTSVKVVLSLRPGSAAASSQSIIGSPIDIGAWLAKATQQNGLEGPLQPWHLVLTYDQFDEDGDNVNSGVYDEIWAGPNKYRRSYKSDKLNQTDYANGIGLFRLGDQRWPDRIETQVRAEVVDPFSYARTLNSASGASAARDFGGYELECILLQGSMAVSDPKQYCFDEGGSVLRYVRGWGWYQTTYNDLTDFQGRTIAHSVIVTDGGKPYLNIRITSLDVFSEISDDVFVAPSDALPLAGKRVTGVMMRPTKMVYPRWPASFRGRKFTVQVDIVVGKDGRVVSAHATSGPDDAARVCEDAIRKWLYSPYKVLGEAVEVETKSMCSCQ